MAVRQAMFGAGCFWGVEAAFREVRGVAETSVGYAGGDRVDPTYDEVCTGATDHAEVVRLEFDPEVVSYDALLALFWRVHDPTTVDRQGPDIGTQYRSVVFYLDEDQARAARAMKGQLEEQGRFSGPIVTQIVAAPPFYRAEEYHQRYLEKTDHA